LYTNYKQVYHTDGRDDKSVLRQEMFASCVTVAASAECKLNVDVGNRQTYRWTQLPLKPLPLCGVGS